MGRKSSEIMETLEQKIQRLGIKMQLEAIVNEYERAVSKHPDWPKDAIHAAAIVAEESGELVRAALQYNYEQGEMQSIQNEAIQTGAMAVRMLRNIANYH